MKTKLLFCLLFTAFYVKAQYVTIPDSNFRKYLIERYPYCFVEDKLDTACASKEETPYFFINSQGISSIEGVHYFSNTVYIDCSDNNISNIPVLPTQLTHFDCSSNKISKIPQLPDQLRNFTCRNNRITNIPDHLINLPFLNNLICSKNPLFSIPSLAGRGIGNLECDETNLSELPELPQYLVYLSCRNNKITKLPILSERLKSLNCDSNQISEIPALPNSLEDLFCANNLLSSLPNLNSVRDLNCSFNQIKQLPEIPITMNYLTCSNNKISSIPSSIKRPCCLYYLTCSNNEISELPELPDMLGINISGNNLNKLPKLPVHLQSLEIENNLNLYCLPFLGNNLQSLKIKGTNISCLPNFPASLQYDTSAKKLPICNPINNKSNCQSLTLIKGRVFSDLNKNNIKENNEEYIEGVKIEILPSGYKTFSNDSGYYEISVDSLKNYSIRFDGNNYYSSINKTVTTSLFGEIITENFALQPLKYAKDISVTLSNQSFARPGFPLALKLNLNNIGTLPTTANLLFKFVSGFTLDSTSILGNSYDTTVQWQISQIFPGQNKTIILYGKVSQSTILGDTLVFYASINPNDITDNNLMNNEYKLKLVVRGSFDPNDKQGPGYVTPKQVQNGEFIEYTIRFQNTGTDTAFTVVIADTLTSNLLPETLEMISTSHSCKTTMKGNQIYFEFLNILLPDSNTNEVKSHGYVRFKVKPRNTLKLGQSILNTASIYFDYNKPVVTNTVNTKVDEPLLTGIQTVTISSNGLAYPNPVENGRLFVSNARGLKYKLNSTQGQLMMNGSIDETGLDVSKLKSGIYILEIGANENTRVEKIVIR